LQEGECTEGSFMEIVMDQVLLNEMLRQTK
jgi:hypothetical protein